MVTSHRPRGDGKRLGPLLGCLLFSFPLASAAMAEGSGIIVISEIMYHPRGGGRDLEYVELANASPAPIDISGWYFSRGIAFVFPENTWLDGGSFLVVAADARRIAEEYGIDNIAGNWAACGGDGGGCALDNGGEAVELSEANGVVHARVRYDDRGRWAAAADGTGHSLEIRDLYAEQDDPDSWLPSASAGGSPGRPNTAAEAAEERPPVWINEALLWTDGERWIELFNGGGEETDLSGFFITDERSHIPKARLPEGTRIAARGWLTLTATELGLDLTPLSSGDGAPARKFVALATPEADRVVDAYIFEPRAPGFSEARIPDGDEDFSGRAEPTPGAENRVRVEKNVVINEILYHPIDEDPRAEFIELFNRGDDPVDLSGWRFTRGIDFDFPDGVVIEPGAYLVVGRDPEHLREVYGLDATMVVGPEPGNDEALERFGRLRDAGERINLRDANGNRADTVRYHDGGRWPVWPDGGGSSLELIDPWQNNNVAAAWDASDDSARAPVREYSYEGMYLNADGSPELRLILLGRGITLVDDLVMFERTSTLQPVATVIGSGEDWKYFKGTEEPPDGWMLPGFDDSDPNRWLTGTTPIGYGEGDEATVVEDMRGSYASLYFRKRFVLPDLGEVRALVLDVEFDDGFIAYLNGTRITTATEGNMRPGRDRHDDTARSSREKVMARIDLSEHAGTLVEGENLLAVQVHNATTTSADLRFTARLVNGEFVEHDGPDVVVNGGFEEELHGMNRPTPGFWFIQGTHVHSGRTTRNPISGSASLKVVATGRGDNKVNRLETTLRGATPRTKYVISFKARWVVGAQTLLTQGYDQNFPRAHALALPPDRGTPGRMNSVTRRRLEATGGDNLSGPVIDKVRQEPALPASGQETGVSARVSDPDGVLRVTLYWSEDTPRLPGDAGVREVAMSGPDPTGRYRASIPGLTGGTDRGRVVWSIVAEDTDGLEGRFPPARLERTHPLVLDPEAPDVIDHGFLVYRHAPPQQTRYPSYRFWMHTLGELYLARRALHSNDPVEGSLVFENRTIYPGAAIRFSGSPFARQAWSESYRVALPKDRPLHGAIRRFQMEDHQRGGARSALERLSNYLIRHNQGTSKVPFSYQWLVQWQVNDRVNEVREHVQYPNREFIRRWYPDDDEGDFFEMDDRHVFTDGGGRAGSTDGRLTFPPYAGQALQLALPHDDEELYRWYFNLRHNDAGDDYSRLIELARVLTPAVTPDAVFDEVIWDVIDVEEFLRVWAVRLNTDDWDCWGARRGKNCYLYRPFEDGRWVLLPWDMELTYNDVNAFMPPPIGARYNNAFQEVARLINRPRIKRMYYGIMKDMLDRRFHSRFLAEWVVRQRLLGMSNLDPASPGGFIDRRAAALRERLEGAVFPQVRLEITTNDGRPFTARSSPVTVEGVAPVEVADVLVLSGGEPLAESAEVDFSDADVFAWRAVVALGRGARTVEFFGFDSRGALVDSDAVEITVDIPSEDGGRFVRGDVDLSGRLSVSDAVASLLHQFAGRPIDCADAADADDDGWLTLTDAVFVLDFLFRAGGKPGAPFPLPGKDPTADDLDCRRGL